MMRLIEQPTGTGDVCRNDQPLGAVHYTLNVYQQYDEGQDEAVPSVNHIEGRIVPAGMIDLVDLWRRGAELLLKMSDGRSLTFRFRDDRGTIVLNGNITTAQS